MPRIKRVLPSSLMLNAVLLDYLAHAILCPTYNDHIINVNHDSRILAATDARLQTRVCIGSH